jgi:hypothetical protein
MSEKKQKRKERRKVERKIRKGEVEAPVEKVVVRVLAERVTLIGTYIEYLELKVPKDKAKNLCFIKQHINNRLEKSQGDYRYKHYYEEVVFVD